ncbi:hypothetical protein GCM10027062_04680 [Nocardioides hungaricus]
MRVTVGPLEGLPRGALKRVTVEGLPPLVIGNADGTVFCLKDECNHGEANLSEGELCGFELLCPLHSGSFDVRSGKAVKRPAKRPQIRFDVEVDDGIVYVRSDEDVDAGRHEHAAGSVTAGRHEL